MKLLVSAFFLISLLALGSCNQAGLGAVTAVKNLITTPYRGAKSAISNYQYNQIKSAEETKRLSFQQHVQLLSSEQVDCQRPTRETAFEDFGNILKEVRQQVCSCKSWGSCTSETCSCETLCPNNFDIFKRRDPIIENSKVNNSMAFRNYDSITLSDIEGTQGYCWGHASLTSKFNRLAFFDGSKKEARTNLDAAPDSKERKESLEYYKKIIDDIADNKVRKIPGFNNLFELSYHPDLQSYLATKMSKEWANKAMTFQGLKTTLSTSPMKREDSQKLLEDIKKKIDNNQQPQLVFTRKESAGFTHTTLISDYRIVDGNIELCVRDNDNEPFLNHMCHNRIKINENGGLYYNFPNWGELGGATIAHNDNADAAVQFHELRSHCASEKDCPLNE
ncbi:hypothetical protein [Halobacteriovorax sp. RT-2-4]|uniref:hypothetical protein n=1 Tax=unclassified Halobacteriovorax TaxID=2639665 RepID=UPI003999E04E